MPDILICGMDVPESCEECVINHTFFRELKCADLPGMRNFGENRLYTDSRNPYCPIHELPPHGDLIDRDALLSRGKNNPFVDSEIYHPCVQTNCREIVMDEPVVVPAERREG